MSVDGLRFSWPNTRLIMAGVFALGPLMIVPGLMEPGTVGRGTILLLGVYALAAAAAVWFLPPKPLWLACVPLLMIPPISAGVIAGAGTATLRTLLFPLVVAAALLRPRLAVVTFVAVPLLVAYHLTGAPAEDITQAIVDLIGNLGVAALIAVGAEQVARRGDADALRAEIASSTTPEELSDAIARHLLGRGVDLVSLFVVDAEPPQLAWLLAEVGTGARPAGSTSRVARGSLIARAGVVGPIVFSPEWDGPEPALLAERGLRSGAILPLRSADRLVGCVLLASSKEHRFRAPRLRSYGRMRAVLSEAVATHLLRLEHIELARLAIRGREFAHRVAAARDVAGLWDAALGGLCEMFGADHGWVAAWDPAEPTAIAATATVGLVPPDLRIDTLRETSITQGVLVNGDPLWVPDVATFANTNRRIADAVPTEAALLIPLHGSAATRGVILLIYSQPRMLGQSSIEVAVSLTAEAGLAWGRIEAEDRLRAQATRDPLTGLLNHAAFHSELAAVLQASRGRHPVALVLCDLDHLKFINDTCGHAAGDEALRELAQVLRTCARRADVVGRLGGDEFAWLLPDASPDDALAAAERAVSVAASTRIPGVGALSVSAGVSVAAGPSDPAGLFERADGALYEAKARGRGMAVAGTSEPPRPVSPAETSEGLDSLAAETLEAAAEHAVREWSSLFRVPGTSLSLVDGALLHELAYVSELRLAEAPAPDYPIADYPLTERALTERRTFQARIDDPEADEGEVSVLREYGWGAVLLVPLLARDRTVGLMELFESRPRTFTAEEQRLALALGQYLAVTLVRLAVTRDAKP